MTEHPSSDAFEKRRHKARRADKLDGGHCLSWNQNPIGWVEVAGAAKLLTFFTVRVRDQGRFANMTMSTATWKFEDDFDD